MYRINIFFIILLLVALSRVAVAVGPQSGYTNEGQVGLSVTNLGYLGNAFSQQSIYGCEYPRLSGGEHLYLGGLWVGARDRNGVLRVSTSAYDVGGLANLDFIREFQNSTDPSYREISNISNNLNYHPDALAPEHIECIFEDDVTQLPGGLHTPMGLKVILRALSWSAQDIDGFVILDYTIINTNHIPPNELRDLHVGIWMDTTVGSTYVTNPWDPLQHPWNFNDDLNGAWRPGDFAGDPTLWMTHEHDEDGEGGAATSWVGCRLLGTEPLVMAPIGIPPVSYNSWKFRGVPDKDDWYVEIGDTTQTPQPGKYQTMSNGHFDVGTTPEGDFSLAGNWSGLLSTGPFPYLAPYDSLRVVFAITLGENAEHLRFNSRLAKHLYDSGYFVNLSATDDVPEANTILHAAVPNPFNPSTTLNFDLATAGLALMSVHDLQGRLVRILVDGTRDAGPHSVSWDGRDDSGRSLASGTYLVRLLSGSESSVVKVVLSK